jgi:hypothetical protein
MTSHSSCGEITHTPDVREKERERESERDKYTKNNNENK